MKYLSLTTPEGYNILPPSYIPGANGVGGGKMTMVDVLHNGIYLFMVVCVFAAVFLLVWSGIEWIMSGGDKAKVDAAKKRLTFVLTGLIIVFGAFFIVSIIGALFRVNLFGLPF